MAKKKATQRPKETTAPSKPPKRKCGPPKGAVLHITSASGLRGSVAVAAGMSRETGKPPQPSVKQKIRKCTKRLPQRMFITPVLGTRHLDNVGQRIPTLSSTGAWRRKYERGVVSQKNRPRTLEVTRRALVRMAPKHASTIANNLEHGQATYDWYLDRFKKANESETEVVGRGSRPNPYLRKIDLEKWNGMMDEGKVLCDAAFKVLQVKAQELLDESAKGPSEARAAEMALEYQIVGVVNETYGPTYPWSCKGDTRALKKSSLVPNPSVRLTYLPAHEVTRENLDALIAWCHANKQVCQSGQFDVY